MGHRFDKLKRRALESEVRPRKLRELCCGIFRAQMIMEIFGNFEQPKQIGFFLPWEGRTTYELLQRTPNLS